MGLGDRITDDKPLEDRKREEIEFHNKKRSVNRNDPLYERCYPTTKYYSTCRSSISYVKSWLLSCCKDKQVLVYGCGAGNYCFFLAGSGAYVTGIDIADVSIDLARRHASTMGLTDRTSFEVMDCEALTFPDSYMDVVVAAAILHHLDLSKAYSEMARVLKPGGTAICVEPLAHNPLIQLYRRLTPSMRTKWELQHILRVNDLKLASCYFGKIEIKFFHLFYPACCSF